MSDLETTPAADPDVVCTELDGGEAVLLHVGHQACFTLNATGLAIWRLAEQRLTLGEIARRLEARFDVSLPDARCHVIELVDELAAAGLLRLADETEAPDRP